MVNIEGYKLIIDGNIVGYILIDKAYSYCGTLFDINKFGILKGRVDS